MNKDMSYIIENAKRELLMMLPDALDALWEIIHDPYVTRMERLAAIRLVMEFSLGKPERIIRVKEVKDNQGREEIQDPAE